MTAPPITQPTVIQQPGIGEIVQGGLAAFFRARELKQQQQQREQQQQQAAEAQQDVEKQRAFNRALAMVEIMGPEILEDPSVAAQLELSGINPASVKKRFTVIQKQEKLKTQQQQDAFVAAFPKELTRAAKGMVQAFNIFETSEPAVATFKQIAALESPETIAELKLQFPELAKLPTEEFLEGVAQVVTLQALVKRNLTPHVMLLARAEAAEARNALLQTQAELARLELAARRKGGTPQELVNFVEDIKRLIEAQIGNVINLVTFNVSPTASREEKIRKIMGPQAVSIDKRLDVILERAVSEIEPRQ